MKPRRLVNLHKTGRFAGVSQIHGVETGTPLTDDEMPTSADVRMLDGEFRRCERVRSTPRVVFYREVVG